MQSIDKRKLLMVLGMHRSGTSALSAALAACGATFGDQLLGAMPGVNAEGFWEDSDVVEVNDRLLAVLGTNWYSVNTDLAEVNWQAARFAQQRQRANQILARGFGHGQLEVIKDPRLCITLPFWLAACADEGIETRVIVSTRAPLEIASSLQKRDAFPLGFGLRLTACYRKLLAASAPADTIFVTYDQLLDDPLALMKHLALRLPLSVDEKVLATTVRIELRHQQHAEVADELLMLGDNGELDIAALDWAIDAAYPLQKTFNDLAAALVGRGEELIRIGEEHSVTLATLDQRDEDILALDRDKAEALGTITERDSQIAEFDKRLSDLGAEHSYALNIVTERDAQIQQLQDRLQRVFEKPGIGLLFKAMWAREKR
jgi:hypothetical protein